HQPPSPIAQYQVNRENVGLPEELIFLHAPRAGRRCRFVGEILTPGDHLHPESAPIRGHPLADTPEPQQSKRAARQDAADRALPSAFAHLPYLETKMAN